MYVHSDDNKSNILKKLDEGFIYCEGVARIMYKRWSFWVYMHVSSKINFDITMSNVGKGWQCNNEAWIDSKSS